MNVKDARTILGVSRDCSLVELKKRYHILALRMHPDKNGNTVEATAAFQELIAAYQLLLLDFDASGGETSKVNTDENNETYTNIFMNFVKSLFLSKHKSENDKVPLMNPILMDLLHRIVNDYASVSVSLLLDSLDPSMLFQLYEMLEQYNAAVQMDIGIFDEITRTIREKMKKNNFIILKPSLKDVIQNNISVVQFEGQTFYVPLWHSELHYRIESEHDASKQLIVKCMPDLPEHMSTDANNELLIDVRDDVKELLSRGSGVLRIPLYDSECVELQVRELHVISRQTVVLRNNKCGISLICSNDIYDVRTKAPICVHVHLF